MESMSEEETFQVDSNENDLSIFEGGRCGICMDIIIERGVLDCCEHWFCFACIDNWSTITNLCPLCQCEFQLITCVPVYDTIGSNNIDDDSLSRDEDWSIEGKSNDLSFPSYYIDENAVICLDGDGCKIRNGSTTAEEDLNLDTSIACDSCDLWYHAFCVGFDPEGTSEDTWLCPRCVAETPQTSSLDSVQRPNNQSIAPENGNGERLAAFSGKVSVSVADHGETAIVVSMVEGNQLTKEPHEDFLSMLEVGKGFESEAFNPHANSPKKTDIASMLEARDLDLSLSREASSDLPSTSLGPCELKTGCVDEKMNEQSSSSGVKSESNIGLHLGLSVGSFLSVDNTDKDLTKDQVIRGVQQPNLSGQSLPKGEKIESGAEADASPIIGVKRNHKDCSDNVHMSGIDEEIEMKETEVRPKKIRAGAKTQMNCHKDEVGASISDDSRKRPTSVAVPRDDKSRIRAQKEDVACDIMSIVKGTTIKPPLKRLACRDSACKSSKEKEKVSGLRVKKIMKRPAEDKDSSVLVQELRKEIREAVRNRSTKDFGDNLFDPKLLAAFRAALGGSKTEPVKKTSHLAVKVKKSMLEKGKVRENLTKKIYGNSNGKRRPAWARDCEVEFWKYRCMRATKPEKIETLKSVLDLLRKNLESLDTEQATECHATNPILSRLYLADTSVFPRKDDIKPLSSLKVNENSEQLKVQTTSMEKASKLTSNNFASKVAETNKVSSKVGFSSVCEKGANVLCSKSNAASSKGRCISELGASKVNSQKDNIKANDVKMDKRKWALEILARKTAAAGRSATHEKQEDNAVLKGNYPLLAQLPADMRPVLAPSRHNKIPISIRQTQLYRLTELFLKKANLPAICRTAETELAVADAINIEKEVADRSNSKVVYVNLCSQEILHRSDDKKSVRATESNSLSPPAVADDELDQDTDKLSTARTVEEALRNAGLLSDSPPCSPHHLTEVQNIVDNSSIETREEGPDNIFEIESHPEVDIYGDFEYDLEDEDYIGISAMKTANLQAEEVSKVKVVFSTLISEKSNNVVDIIDAEGNEVHKDSTCLAKSHTDAGIKSSTEDKETGKSCARSESLPCEEGEDVSLAECEELYGPDKEPLVNKLPEVSQKLYEVLNGEASAENAYPGDASHLGTERHDENATASMVSCNPCGQQKSPDNFQTGDRMSRKEGASNTSSDKQQDNFNLVSKTVEAYIKEHIRPLCKSGVITAEQYRWAVAKTTDKVMKYHSNAKNANFLIKEGEKVKKLAEQYVEAAQQKGN